MIIAHTINEITQELAVHKDKKIAFVPTMGFLHQGHLALVKKAASLADIVIVSIFVNKSQFNNANDYDNYPRDIENDIKKLKNSAATHIFIPQNQEILANDLTFLVKPNVMANCLCGSTRPGHFDGVCLILAKFFNILSPDFAIFGKKDFQQYLIVKKMCQDLNYKTKIIGIEAVRQESGLVLSSRNNRLNLEQQKLAPNIKLILDHIRKAIIKNPNDIAKILNFYQQKFYQLGFAKIDYLEVRDEENLNLVTNYNAKLKSRIFIAVFLGQVRLIDNISIN